MDKLNYVLLTNKDLDSAVDCAVKVFLYDEPMTKNLGITEPQFRVFAAEICKKCAKEKLSYVCKNEKGKIIGFILNEDLINNEGFPFDKITRKMQPIFSILNKLDTSYLENKPKKRNIYFHLFMGGTLAEYRNKGIVKKLIKKSLSLSKEKRYKIALGEATNLKSQNLVKSFGFKEVGKVSYLNFEFNGVRVFKNIGEEYCKLMELKIP